MKRSRQTAIGCRRLIVHSLFLSLLAVTLVVSVTPDGNAQSETAGSGTKGKLDLARIQLADGSSASGEISSLSNRQIQVLTEEGIQSFKVSEVATIEFKRSPVDQKGTSDSVLLVDGSRIFVEEFQLINNTLSSKSRSSVIQIPSRDIIAVLTPSSTDASNQRQLLEFVKQSKTQADGLVVLRDNDLRNVEGLVRSIDGETVEFTVADRTAKVKLSRLEAIIFFHAVKREFEPAPIRCQLVDGSEIAVREIRYPVEGVQDESKPEKSTVTLQTSAGPIFNVEISSIRKIDFGVNSTISLSDLQPATNDWRPLTPISSVNDLLRKLNVARFNRTYDEEALSLKFKKTSESRSDRLKTYNAGIAMVAGGKLTFRLNRKYQRIQGLVGFAPEVQTGGTVQLRLVGDGQELWKQELVRTKMKNPVSFDLDVSRTERLLIEVDYLDGRSAGDRIHLVDLALTPSSKAAN